MAAYVVTARTWDKEEAERFGAGGEWSDTGPGGVLKPVAGPVVELPDETLAFLKEVTPFGRFSVDFEDAAPHPHLHFYNDYD